VVHRDIKPDNLLLSGRHALVTDLGVAKAVTAAAAGGGGTTLTSTGMALGTPAYMAPEQAAADPRVDARADVYALGVVAYEMLAGRPPFTAPTAQAMLAAQVAMRPDPVDRYRPGIPADLSALVMRALEKIPGDRPQSAEEMLGRLDAVRPMTPVSGLQSAPTVPTPAVAAAGMRTPRLFLLFALATVALTATAYGVSRLAGLPDWVWVAVLGAMIAGLPVVLYTNRIERRRAELRATGEHRISGEHTHQRWFTWRRALSGGGAAIGAIILLSGAYVVSRKLGIGPAATLLSAGTLGSEDRLVLSDFVNRTADSSLGAAVTEALRVDLGQSRAVRLLDGRQVASALQRMGARADTTLDESLARTLAIREGAKAIVAGDISRLGSGYVLTARIVTADSGATLAPVRVTADDDAHLIGAVNHLSADLRERIGESLRTIRSTEPLEQVTTASLPALRLYTAGTRAFDAGRLDIARQLLERATQTDTAFAMAWRKLAAVYFNLGAGVPAQFAAATRAFNHRDRLPPLERYLTEGFYYTQADPERAIAAYRAAIENSPGDNTAVNNLGLVLNRIGRSAVAESVLRAAMAAKPTMTVADNLVDALAAQSKWVAIDTVLAQADRAAPPSHPGRVIIRLTAAFARRDYARAESLIAANEIRKGGALPMPPVFNSRIVLDIYRGRFARATRLAREVSESTLARGERRDAAEAAIVPAALLATSGRTGEAKGELKAALGGPVYRDLPDAQVPVWSLAQVYAALGDVAGVRRARQIFETTQPPMSRLAGDSVEWVALEAQAEHRWREAAAGFSREADIRKCSPCGSFSAGQMWEAAGVPDSAIAYYRLGTDRPELYSNEEPSLYPLVLRRLGDLYEQRGDRAAAIEWYSRFVDLWHDADPDLQPVVREIRDRIARLTAEPRSP
jgi:tetratricopeptide (TPR) repeat protein